MWYIIYKQNRSELCLVEIEHADRTGDYKLASREKFGNELNAAEYAKELAAKHGLTFVPDTQEQLYLD